MLSSAEARAAVAALFLATGCCEALAQSQSPPQSERLSQAPPGAESGPRVIPLPPRGTRNTVPVPSSGAPRGGSEPSGQSQVQDDAPEFSGQHSRYNSQREERRGRWRDDDRDYRGPRGRGDDRRGSRRDSRQDQKPAAAERPGSSFGAGAGGTPIWLDQACSPDRDQRVAAYLGIIEERTRPTGDQTKELDNLKKAASSAGELLRPVCEVTPALTPTRQIDVVERRAKAVLSAIDVLKPALESFYTALDDEQKARFNAISTSGEPATASRQPPSTNQPVGATRPDYARGPESSGDPRGFSGGQDFASEPGNSAEQDREPRRKKRRSRSYRYYYRW
jgi:hypothetical protein